MMRSDKKLVLSVLAFVGLQLLLVCGVFAVVPDVMSYQGRLTNTDGDPLTGTYDLTFAIYDSETGGNLAWGPETHTSVVITDGLFSVKLGAGNPPVPFSPLSFIDFYDNFDTPSRWLEIGVEGELISPRTQLTMAPYSYYVHSLNRAKGGYVQGSLFLGYDILDDRYHLKLGPPGIDFRSYDESSQTSDDIYLTYQWPDQGLTLYGAFPEHPLRLTFGPPAGPNLYIDGGPDPNSPRLRVSGRGSDVGGVTNYEEVTAIFEQTYASPTAHSAIVINAPFNAPDHPERMQDAILYFSAGGYAIWDIRNDVDAGHRLKFRWQGATGENQDVVSMTTGNACIFGSWTECSDRRFKQKITPITGAIDVVSELHGVNFHWKQEAFPKKGFTDDPQIGFIAQEVQTVLPQVVVEDEEGYLSIDYSRLTPVLVEAMKEQQTQIDTQRDQLEAQQKQIDELKEMVTRLAARSSTDGSSYGMK